MVQTVPVSLPKVKFEPTSTKPENVSLTVRSDGGGGCEVYWGLTKVGSEDLLDRAVNKLKAEIKRQGGVENLTEETMPEAHIRGDVNTPYKCVGGAIFTMQRAGFARVGFISEPPAGSGVVRL
jgi:biopolymer transport protein ExbD